MIGEDAVVGGGAREVWLRDEVARLGGLIEAPPEALVSFDPGIDAGAPYISVEPGGPYRWMVKERGETLDHRTTNDVDDVLFWSFEASTASMASRWAAEHGDEQQDFRIAMWAKQQELLMQLNPLWVDRWRARLIAEVPGAERMLPSL